MRFRGALLFAFQFSLCAAIAQDPLMRMDPDDWCSRDDVQQAIGMLDMCSDAYTAMVRFDDGAIVQIANGYGRWSRRADDLRLVLDSNGVNVARSHNQGFNLGAYHFNWKGRFLSLGGMGFWNEHALLVEFIPQTGEWELMPSENKPGFVHESMAWLDQGRNEVLALEHNNQMGENWSAGRPVYSLDLETRTWNTIGVVNPKLAVHFEVQWMTSVELEDYKVWMAQHKIIVMNKVDRRVVESVNFNRKMWRDALGGREAGEHSLWGTRKGELFLQFISAEKGVEEQLSLDIAALYEAGVDEAYDLIVPGSVVSDAGNAEEGAQGMPLWSFALLLLGLPMAFAAGRSKGSGRKGSKAEDGSGERQEEATVSSRNGLSLLTRNFLDSEVQEMDTAALNAFLGLDGDLSEETRRSRRAHAVRQVNQEYRLFCGQDLIYRVKDPGDRRRTTYFIKPGSESA